MPHSSTEGSLREWGVFCVGEWFSRHPSVLCCQYTVLFVATRLIFRDRRTMLIDHNPLDAFSEAMVWTLCFSFWAGISLVLARGLLSLYQFLF